MVDLTLYKCQGIDTREAWSEKDIYVLDEGDNIQILPGGAIASRPACIKVCDLSTSSVGLYARGGLLRSLVASGLSVQQTAPTEVVYDPIGQGGTFDYSGKIGRIVGAETFGTSQVYGPHGYIAFKRIDTALVEHHWIKEPPASGATFTSTKVALPFQPGEALTKVDTKLVATDPANGYFRYSSSLSADDWTSVGDAGFEAALQFVSGSREITALGVHRSSLAVFYSDAVQLWFMDPVPANIYRKEVMSGPGTTFPKSVANVYGDAYFLSNGVFSTLATATTVGQADYTDAGIKIKTLTSTIPSTAQVNGVWSQKRGQYLVAVDSQIYCFGFYPAANEKSWTRWQMPETIDYLVENNGVVYYRSGNVLYRLDDAVGRDSGVATDIAWNVLTIEMGFGRSQSRIKSLNEIVAKNTARCTYTPIVDGRELTSHRVVFPASTSTIRSHFSGSGRRIAVRMAGTGLMRIDGIAMAAEVCGI